MFPRVSNTDLLKKIDLLEKKIENNNQNQLVGCNCNKIVYEELKSCFETKFDIILNNLKENANNDKLNESKINYILREHKRDIIENFETIISNVESLNKIHEETNLIQKFWKNVEDHNKTNGELLKEILDKLKQTFNKIDLLYYENETIKHRLLLEQDIRKYEIEIDNLKSIIHKTVETIDEIIKKK